ncbi:MAG: HAD-IIB family hydrolase [Anaerolineae bacterium]|nr:HAD-IIB family hydrolase [Anaerolineae bacterium]
MDDKSCRLIAVDLDGTLLRSDSTLAPGGARALAEAAQCGVWVVLASARNPYSAGAFAREMGLHHGSMPHPLICSNGAQVWASPDGPVWSCRGASPMIAEALTGLADARGWSLVTTVGEVTYFCQRPGQALGARDVHHHIVATNAEVLRFGAPVRILNYEAEAIPAIRALLETDFAGQYYLETYYYPDNTVKSIGVYAPGSDKGTALALVLERLGIDQEAVLAIGDNPNDLPMFAQARIRVAMGNATADVKAQATAIAPTNDEEGVAWAVKQFNDPCEGSEPSQG